MATQEIVKLADGTTRYKFKVRRKKPDGKVLTRIKQFRTRTAGERWARRLEAQLDRGKAPPSRELQKLTFADLCKRYREDVIPGYDKDEQIKRKTRLAWWEGHLGLIRLRELRRPQLLDCLGYLERGEGTPSGRPVGPATRRRYIGVLHHALNIAVVRWEWMEHNPAVRLARPERDREPPGRVRYLGDEERERFLMACEGDRERLLAPLVKLALFTGCRAGELLRIRWRHIDWQRQQLALAGDDGQQRTKNRHGRSVALNRSALAVFRELRKVRHAHSDLVFANGNGVARFPQRAFERAVKAAELEDFRFHDLRHTFASYLLMSGASLAELAEAMGHKTLAMVKRYAHISRSHAASVVQRMEQRLHSGGFG